MARRVSRNNEDIAQAFSTSEMEKVKAYVQTLAESDPEIYAVLTKFDDSIRIEDALGEHYEDALAIDTRSRRKQGDKRLVDEKVDAVKRAYTTDYVGKPFISAEDGKAYIIEDLLRDPTLITEDTPADVIHRKNELYPTRTGLREIPAAPPSVVTDGQLEAMALAHVRRDMPSVIPMDVASRSASPELLAALERQGLFTTDLKALDGSNMNPIHRLQYSGARGDTARNEAGTGPSVRAVMLGDKVRNINPVTGADLGNSFVLNGVRVRPAIQGGHGLPHHGNLDRTHDPMNIGAEDRAGNQAKNYDNKMGLPEDNLGALIRKVRKVKKERSLQPFVDTLKARARNEAELMDEWGPLIAAVESELQ